MKKQFLISAALLISGAVCAAQTTPRWIRHSSISPDGEQIAFSYQGDIFTVSSKGGQARQITSNSAFDSEPMWSADGKKIVFVSYRELSKDIYVTSAQGGTPRRLTSFSGNETLLAVTPDGYALFSANAQQDASYDGFPGTAQLYRVSLEGGAASQVTSLTVSNISINADGTAIYEDYKGYEDALRKHHTSSVTRDIWMYSGAQNAAASINGDGKFTKLSSFAGEDRNPVFAADGRTFYYLSEEGGNFNVWRSSIDSPAARKQVTSMPVHPVRYLSIASNGMMCFSWNGDLYTFTDGAEPSKVEISLTKDSEEREKVLRSLSVGAGDLSISPNGKEVAFVAHGDVFVTSIDYKTTKRITNTAVRERGTSFSSDGRELYYAAERNGFWGIYKTSLTEKADKYFTYSYRMKEELVTTPGQTCFQPAVSPDGKKLAFLRDRTEIVVKDLKSGKEKSLMKGCTYSYSDGDQSFSWSPDSRYILCDYQAGGGWNNTDVALIDVESGEITDLTQSGYSDGSFRWAMKGKAMTWTSDKAGFRSHGSWGAEKDVYAMFFDGKAFHEFSRDKEAADLEKLLLSDKEKKKEEKKEAKEAKDSVKTEKKAEKLMLDLENRVDRIVRLTKISGRLGDHFLTNDGSKLYYVQRLEKSSDLCQLDIKTGAVKVVQKNFRGSFIPDRDGKFIYVSSPLGISRIDPATGTTKGSIAFSAEYDYYPAAEREYIFTHAWKQVKEKFYDADIHGIDWDGFKANYEQFLPYITNNFDFQELLSELLGELNGSHTGARYQYRGGQNTAHFGVLFDLDYNGEGLRIKEVLPGSALALVDPEIKAGDVIEAIDGEKIAGGQAWWEPLTMKGGKKLMLTIRKGGRTEDVFVTSTFTDQTQLYTRWVRQREAMVEKLSGGRIGYVHVQGMNSDSFREVYSKALGKYRHCDALIVDTRHNGGGWLHDDLATFLSGKAYIDFIPRGQYIGTEPYSKWLKPSCVLMGEDNYSDASGFPYVYKALGIGKLIGAPVPGTMTAVWWETQIDATLVFGIPEVTSVSRTDGSILENQEIEPDILIYNDPASALKGEDKQLEAAVAEMLGQISK